MAVACTGSAKRSSDPTITTTTVDPAVTAGQNLKVLIIQPPVGFDVDPTKGATGAVTPDVFSQYGGYNSASTAGFVAGYKQGYADGYGSDGLAITLFKFATASDAQAYFQASAPRTLSLAEAQIAPFSLIPAALYVTGTKEYGGEYAHAIVFNRGAYYVDVTYVNVANGPAPGELKLWAKAQYLQL